jgi:putative intracellular protease/amidase
MKKYISYTMIGLLGTIALSNAASKEDMMQEKEKAAWQAFKDKKADDFKKLVVPGSNGCLR